MRGSSAISAAELPKPRSPRSLAGQLVDLDRLDGAATGRTTSCAIRIPGSTTNGSSRSVLSRMTLSSPR